MKETTPGPADEAEGLEQDPPPEPPLFPHPDWTVGVVLIFGVVALVAGFRNPIWWLIGSPVILALAIYLWIWIRAFALRE